MRSLGGEDFGGKGTEADFLAGGEGGVGGEGEGVSVFEEGAGLAGFGEGEVSGSFPGQFEEGAFLSGFGAADGAGGVEVAEFEGGSVGGLVGDLLGDGPVEVAGVGLADFLGTGHFGGLEVDFEGDVEVF